jgi:hypothetical protein
MFGIGMFLATTQTKLALKTAQSSISALSEVSTTLLKTAQSMGYTYFKTSPLPP